MHEAMLCIIALILFYCHKYFIKILLVLTNYDRDFYWLLISCGLMNAHFTFTNFQWGLRSGYWLSRVGTFTSVCVNYVIIRLVVLNFKKKLMIEIHLFQKIETDVCLKFTCNGLNLFYSLLFLIRLFYSFNSISRQ